MWTHIQPFTGADLTASAITRSSSVGLSRALQLLDPVVLLGSGVSMPLGYPAWSELAAIFVQITSDIYTSDMYRRGQSSAPDEGVALLAVELWRILHPDDANARGPVPRPSEISFRLRSERAAALKDDVNSVMDLCEELLERMGCDEHDGKTYLHHARLRFAHLFRAGGPAMMLRRLELLLDYERPNERSDGTETPAIDPARLPRDWRGLLLHMLNSDPDGGALEQLRSSYADAFPECFEGPDPDAILAGRSVRRDGDNACRRHDDPWGRQRPERPEGDGLDVIGSLLHDLGIRRFLTLNYDVEVERAILGGLRKMSGDAAKAFRTLCERCPTRRDDPARVTIEDGARRAVVSATLNSRNIGELIGFAALDESYDRQVFHLHGRIDDPDNLVLTQRDYRRVYMRDGHARSQFEEVQEMLFGGNPILFIGTGVSEADVLQPLRRFVSRSESMRASPRTIFALLPANHESDADLRDALAAIQRVENFNVSTLYYGGERYCETHRALRDLGVQLENGAFGEDGSLDAEVGATLLRVGALLRREVEHHPDARLLFAEDVDAIMAGLRAAQARADRSATAVLLGQLVRDLSGRVQTRALIHELGDIKRRQAEWWDEWRRPPAERRARPVRVEDPADAVPRDYLWVRHCPGDAPGSGGPDALLAPVQIRAARRIRRQQVMDRLVRQSEGAPPGRGARGRQPARSEGRRILRLAIPRGGGAGAFMRQIMLPQNHGLIFQAEGEAQTVAYAAAFVSHLSYSIEFNSVISALTQFLARRVADMQWERRQAWPVQARQGGDPNSRRAFLDSREEQPRLAERPELRDAADLGTEERQPHRLDVLKRVLEVYAELWQFGEASREPHRDRVFVCLSGLDLLCDGNGDAHNPAHRAFFRLLTGQGLAEGDRDATDAPVDLVVVSGEPGLPICYLSEELAEDRGGAAKAHLLRVDVPTEKDLPTEEEKNYSRMSKTERVLRHWEPLEPVAWMERIAYMRGGADLLSCCIEMLPATLEGAERTSLDETDHDVRGRYCRWYRLIQENRTAIEARLDDAGETGCRHLLAFLAWATQVDRHSNETVVGTHPHRTLIRLLWDNLALSNWALTYWLETARAECDQRLRAGGTAGQDNALREAALFESLVGELDRAALPPGGADGVLQAVLDGLARLDRTRAQTRKAAGTAFDVNVSVDPVLNDLLLRHLALFALPVEPMVILDCPMIRRRIDHLARKTRAAARVDLEARIEGFLTPRIDREAALAFRLRRLDLELRLRVLRTHLETLEQRLLLMRVHPSVQKKDETPRRADFVHWRFSLHAGLRSFIAKDMELSIRDRGDRNHFQVTLYFDQPRDLPTPALRHFEMIQGIIEAHIRAYRQALRPAYAFSQMAAHWRARRWDEREVARPRRIAAAAQLVPLVYRPGEAPNGAAGRPEQDALDIDCLDIHAVAQRLRGVFSLLRGTFSLASVSRLQGEPRADRPLAPFDTYNGWLRSLLNAAIGVDVNAREMTRALEGKMFASEGDDTGSIQTEPVDADWRPRRLRPSTAATAESLRARETARRILAKEAIDEASGRLGTARGTAGTGGLGTVVPQGTGFQRPRNPFYRDEIAWLYNERALTLLIQGKIHDALPLFERARFVMAHQRQTPESDTHAYHATERRISLNQSVAMIQAGALGEARALLERLERSSAHVHRSTPSQTMIFARAYLALCDHMAGSLERAEKGYRVAIEAFNDRRQLRAVSIFNRHQADLHRLRGEFNKARRTAGLAVKAASQAEQKDIQQLARLVEADIAIRSGDTTADPSRLIAEATRYAEQMNLLHLRAEARIVHARLMLGRGEVDRAGASVSRAIALCLAGGLRLRKLSALHLEGEVAAQRGDEELARRLFAETKAEAEQIGYQTLAARLPDTA